MKTVIIDGKNLTTRKETHSYLKKTMNFPDYYGNNLDALYDCLTDISEKTEIHIINIDSVKKRLGNFGKDLINVFTDASEDNTNIIFITEGKE